MRSMQGGRQELLRSAVLSGVALGFVMGLMGGEPGACQNPNEVQHALSVKHALCSIRGLAGCASSNHVDGNNDGSQIGNLTVEPDACACQQRCASTPTCVTFVFNHAGYCWIKSTHGNIFHDQHCTVGQCTTTTTWSKTNPQSTPVPSTASSSSVLAKKLAPLTRAVQVLAVVAVLARVLSNSFATRLMLVRIYRARMYRQIGGTAAVAGLGVSMGFALSFVFVSSARDNSPTCSPTNAPHKLSVELIRQHKCGRKYHQKWEPAYHLPLECGSIPDAQPHEDEELMMSLANFAFADCGCWCVYSIIGPKETWWKWRTDKECWQRRDPGCLRSNRLEAEVRHVISLRSNTLCSAPSSLPSLSTASYFYDPMIHTPRRVHISITGLLSCPSDWGYPFRHLEQLVSGLRAQGHQVFIYAGVSSSDEKTQGKDWDRLLAGWGASKPHPKDCMRARPSVLVLWDAMFTQPMRQIIAKAGGAHMHAHCVRNLYNFGFPPNAAFFWRRRSNRFCDIMFNQFVKLKEAWLQMEPCMGPDDIVIRTRPDLIMRCHKPSTPKLPGLEEGWGVCWPDPLPRMRSYTTVAVSEHFRYGFGVSDNFAIMAAGAAEKYFTIYDRLDTLIDVAVSQNERGLLPRGVNPEALFATNLRELDVQFHDWIYELAGSGSHHQADQLCGDDS